MASILDLRRVYPTLEGYSDKEVVDWASSTLGVPFESAAEQLGWTPPTFGREFRNAVPRGLGQMVQGVGQLAEDFGWDDNFVKEYGQRVIERNPSQINSLADIAEYPTAALGSATGNALSFLGPQLGVGLLGKGAAAYGLARTGAALQGMGAQAAVAGLPSYGGIREQQIDEGHDLLSDKLVAGAGAATVGLIENLGGAQRLLGIGRPGTTIRDTIRDQFGATPWRTAGRVLGKSTLQEGAEELAQNPIEQMAAYHDPRTSENIQETLFSGAMGALGGLGMGGAIAPYRGLQHRGLRDELRADQFIDPTAQAPTDLLRGLDAVDQLADMDQRIGSYGDYRYLQALHDQGQSEALRRYQEEQARRQEIERARAATPFVDQFHTDLDYQNRWRESQMPYGYGEIDPTLEVPTAPPRYAADVDPNLPAPGRPTVASAASGEVEQAEPKPVEPSKETQRLVAALTEYQAAGQITPEEYDTAVGQLMAAEAKVQAAPRGTKKAIRKSVLAPVHKATGAFIQSKFKGATDANSKSVRKGRAVKGVQAKDVPGAQTQVGASAESTQGTGVQTTQTNQGEVNGTQTTETALSEVRQETRQGPALPGEQVTRKPFAELSEGNKALVAAFMGYDAEGNPTPTGTGLSARQIAKKVGGSHTNITNQLKALGYTEDFKNAELLKQATEPEGGAQDEEVVADEDAGTTKVLSDEAKVHGEESSDAATRSMGTISTAGGSQGDVGAGTGWRKLLAAKTPFSATKKSDGSLVWTDDTLHTAMLALIEEKGMQDSTVQRMIGEARRRETLRAERGAEVTDAQSAWEDSGMAGNVKWKNTNENPDAAPDGLGPKQQERVKKLLNRLNAGEIDQDKFDSEMEALAKQVGEQGVSYSEGQKVKKPTSVRMIDRVIDALFMSPARKNQLIRVYATQAEAHAALGDAAFSQTASRKKGFTLPADAAKSLGHPPVGLIAENIPEGQELSIVLHELGVHLGMEGLVGAENMKWLADRIEAWRQRNDGSVESNVAKWAYEQAVASESATEDRQEELIAYMVEGLVRAGITPQAATETEAHTWFRRLWAAAKSALRKLGFKNPKFSGQHLVDLAYGAADLELQGAWHGTAADFRNFNHKYMGSGEGAQAYGWGTYLAQRVGIAKEYWRADVARKDEPTKLTYEGVPFRDFMGDLFVNEHGSPKQQGLSHFVDAAERYKNVDKAVASAAKWLREGLQRPEAASWLEANKNKLAIEGGTPEGSLMRVAVNARDEELLDFDAPFSEQSELVQDTYNFIVNNGQYEGAYVASEILSPLTMDTVFPVGHQLTQEDLALLADEYMIDNIDISKKKRGKVENVKLYNFSTTRDAIKANETGNRLHDALAYDLYFMQDNVDYKQTKKDQYGRTNGLTGKGWDTAYELVAGLLDAVGIKGNKFLDKPSRGKALQDIKKEFLAALPEDAEIEDVMAEVGTGAFNAKQEDFLEALAANDWLGFDYPAQAISAALGKDISNYDPSPELLGAITALQNDVATTRNFVVFNDKNVQRVSTQVGAGRSSGNIKFSEAPARAVRDLGRDLQIGTGSVWERIKPKLLTTHQLVDQFGDKLKSLKEYVRATDSMDQFQKKLAVDAHPIMLKWQAIPAAVRKQLHSVMLDATTWEIHPDLPMTDPLNKQVTDATKYNALKSRYEALPADAKQTYKDARDMFKKLWDMRGTEFDKLVDASYAKLIANDPDNRTKLEAKRDSIKEDHSKQLKSIQGPYFPLLRFGDFITMGMSDEYVKVKESLNELTGKELAAARKKLDAMKKDPKHYIVYASETKAAATAKARQVEALGLNSHMQLVDEKFSALSPLNANGLEQLRNLFSNEFGKADANKIGELLTEVYINSLPEHSALQRQLKRVGVAGAEENMLRVFAQAVERDSFHISRMKFQDAISEQLFKMKQEANASGTEFGHVYNNVRARMNMDFQYQRTPVISMINRLSSFWHLGVSPAYLLTNATQPWMITMPVLSGQFKKNAMPYMTRGWNDAKKMIVVSKKNGAFADINFDTLADKNERDMLQQVRDLGQIDITINFDIGNVADDVNPRWLKLQKVLSFANHHIEVSNRITTALAAYRMAKDAKMSHEAAVDAAYKAVVNTQLDYSDTNAAYFMKGGHFGGLNKMVMQFRKYQQGMLYLIAQNTKLAFQGDKDAMRSLGYLMAMQGAFAGAAGIPFLTAAMFVAGLGFGGGDDKDGDLETQLRNWLADTIGADAARVFWKGLPAMFGIDVSKRVGMGDMWNPMPFLRMGGEKTGQEKLGKVAVALGGAPVGTLANFMDAAMLAQEGQLARASEKLLPKMLADPIKATRYGDEGLMTRKGTPVMGNRAFSAGDLAQQALGFTPLKITEHYDAANAKENTARAIKERRENLIAQWAKYKIKNDAAEVKSMDEAIYNWNVKHPDKGQRIDRSSLIKAANNRKKAAKETNAAGVRYQKSESGLKGIDRFAAGA